MFSLYCAGMEPKALCMLGKRSTNWAPSLAPPGMHCPSLLQTAPMLLLTVEMDSWVGTYYGLGYWMLAVLVCFYVAVAAIMIKNAWGAKDLFGLHFEVTVYHWRKEGQESRLKSGGRNHKGMLLSVCSLWLVPRKWSSPTQEDLLRGSTPHIGLGTPTSINHPDNSL